MVVYGVNIYRCSDANGKDWYETIINIRNQSTGESLMFPSGRGKSLKEANQKALESLISMQKDLTKTIGIVKKEIEKV